MTTDTTNKEAGALSDTSISVTEWHWSLSDEGPMTPCGTEDVAEALRHALFESGIATYGEDQTNIFMCRFRPARINWKRHIERLLESIDEECFDVDGRNKTYTDGTDIQVLETALLRVRNDASPAASGGERS